ncbi:hypothetical protein [Halobacteriovorax sp. DA5]|uniref:hypothetical protein n=1 Tax=Halobacteriovorax sp. DA5 TaxID=2067553 RepID=UPI000CCFF5B6|nr:hypothetical protein [Halobacteriovorax sp. DA5]POB13623.1 hypothetical protein C0Z22_10690 [Halobacteriovorax sp. DA5]
MKIEPRDNTIIIGAGAGVPFGMPTGAELRDMMLKVKRPTAEMNSALNSCLNKRRRHYEETHYEEFLEMFKEANTISIDSFLSNQAEYINIIGKVSIANILLSLEKKSYENTKYSYCAVDRAYNSSTGSHKETKFYKDNWIQLLLNFLNPKDGDEKKFLDRISKINFVSFNYDRMLEQSLVEHYYHNYDNVRNGDWQNKYEELQEALSFRYVYGSLGKCIPKNIGNRSKRQNYIFSEQVKSMDLVNSAEGITLIRNDHEELDYSFINKSKNIFCLGFSFDEDNLKLLKLLEGEEMPSLYVTSLGLEEGVISKLDGRYNTYLDYKETLAPSHRIVHKRKIVDCNVSYFSSHNPSTDALRNLKL